MMLLPKRILRGVFSAPLKLRKPVNALIFVNCILTTALVVRLRPSHLVYQTHNDVVSIYQHQLTMAMEAFDFLYRHRLGKNPVEVINWTPRQIRPTSCWPWRQPARHDTNRTRPRWQRVGWMAADTDANVEKQEVQLFDAYYDGRVDPVLPDADGIVRLLAMSKRTVPTTLYCQLWWTAEDGDSHFLAVRADAREVWQRPWDPRTRFYIPLLIDCPIPKQTAVGRPPDSVSVVTNACGTAHNAFRIPFEKSRHDSQKNKVVVCVKGMDFLKDVSVRLVEWLELQKLLGADRVLMYTYYVHPTTERVLDYYAKTGFLVKVSLTLPGDSPNFPYQRSRFIWRNRQQKRRNEIIPYNDCLYRHVNTHNYALIIDTDEVVVPMQHRNWTEMLSSVRRSVTADKTDDQRWTSFSVRNVFKFDRLTTHFNASVPAFAHTLRHRRRSTATSKPGEYGKSFMYLPNLLTVFNHYALHRLKPDLRTTLYLTSAVAQKLHYKEQCPVESRDECPDLIDNTVDDPSLDRFADELIVRVERVLKQLRLKYVSA